MYARPINRWYALQKPWVWCCAVSLRPSFFSQLLQEHYYVYFMWFGSNLLDWNINGIIIVENNLLLSEFHNTIHNLNWIVFKGWEMANHSIKNQLVNCSNVHRARAKFHPLVWHHLMRLPINEGPALLTVVLTCKVSRQLLVHLLHHRARSWCDPKMFSFSSSWASWVRWGLYILSMSAKDWKACTTG